MTNPHQVERYRGGNEHYERCHGLHCPCYQEGRAEGTIGDGQSHAADAAQAPQPDRTLIGPDSSGSHTDRNATQ
jgi:hypothetical protein